MTAVIFSVTAAVSLTAAALLPLKRRLVRRYGFRLIYALSLILAVRLLIPYSVQIPNIARFELTLPRWVLSVWLIGAAISMLYHAAGFMWFRSKLRRNGRTVKSGAAREGFERVKADMFVEGDIGITLLADISSPMLMGFFRPVIVLPETAYSETEYEMIFRHELTHFERRDNFKKLLFALVTSLQWFNPFAYMMMNEAYESIECLCDEKVTAREGADFKREYCLMLLSTGKRRNFGRPAVSYFSGRDRLKARIGNIFERRTGRRGAVPVILVTLSAVFLSGMLCSCTVETPQDVLDEMNRIETGISNEKQNEAIPQFEGIEETEEKAELLPVSEVTANAQDELAALNETNGIFKLDNTRVNIPQKDAFKIFDLRQSASVNNINDIYEQYYWLEEEFLGDHYPLEEITAVYIFEKDGESVREEAPLSEAMSRSDLPFAVLQMNNAHLGRIEWLPWEGRCWFTKELGEVKDSAPKLDHNGYLTTIYVNATFNIDEEVYASTADEETMNKKRKLYRGEMSLREAGEWCENYVKTIPYIYDKNISFKAEMFEVRGDDELCTILVFLMTYVDGVPYPAENLFMMIQPDKVDQVFFPAWDMEFVPREDEKITEIVPLTAVFDTIKKQLSNSIVYDVDTIMLGYGTFDPSVSGEWSKDRLLPLTPLWTVELHTVNKEISVTVDAATGECRITDNYK